MSIASDLESEREKRVATVASLPKISGNIDTAVDSCTPVGSIRNRSRAGGFGLLSLAAMTFAMLKGAQGAEPNVAVLDDDRIDYKDLEHGTFELLTKEPVPRHIIVEDPGETVVVRRSGSSVSVNAVGNSMTRMEELAAAQQDALANYVKGLGAAGSSAPPFSAPGLLQPINFIQNDDPQAPQHSLPPLPALVFPKIDTPIVRPPPPPPTLNVLTGPTEVDTSVFDTFTVTNGTFTAASTNGGALTFGIGGGTAQNTVLDGATFDVSRANSFGTLFLNSATGAYVFVPDSNAINALQAPTTESFTITVSDGSQSVGQTFTIAINGTNDAAHVSGTTAAAAIEAGGTANAVLGAPTVSGTLTATDVDNPPNTFTEVGSPTASTGGYGTFTITAAGVWTYTIDNANSAVQALNVGDKLTDTFTVTTIDGTPQVVTITIDGANDAAIISGVIEGSVTEPRCEKHGRPTATGTLTDADVDNAPNTFVPVTCAKSAGGYGTFTMTAAGVWIYTLDTDNCAVRALDSCETLTDSFTVTTIDGTEQVVSITIHGAQDKDGDEYFDHAETGLPVNSDAPIVPETAKYETTAAADDSGQIGDGNAGQTSASDSGNSDAVAGENWAHGLSGHSTGDHFVYLSTEHLSSGQSAARLGTVSDFKPKSERVELTAFGTAAFVILALDSTSSTVPPHTIAWIYDATANETIVYVNPTDQTLTIGDSGLQEVHLQGMASVDPSDFVFAPETAAVAAVIEPADLDEAATALKDAAAIAATTSGTSPDTTLADRTLPADGKWGDRDRIEVSTCNDDVRTPLTEHMRGEAMTTSSSGQPPIEPLHVLQVENAFAPQPTATPESADAFPIGKEIVSSPVHTAGVAVPDAAEARTDPQPDKHGSPPSGHHWFESRGDGQFNFGWRNEDHGKADGSMNADGGIPSAHVHASSHGNGAFHFEPFLAAHATSVDADMSGPEHSFHFKGDLISAPAVEVPDHATSSHITHHVHDLMV